MYLAVVVVVVVVEMGVGLLNHSIAALISVVNWSFGHMTQGQES